MFALHPVHVESVAWVTERKNTLSAFFYLAAAYVYLFKFNVARASRPSEMFPEESSGGTPKPRMRWYALSIALFICALLSKSVTASLPAAILLVIWWKRGRIAIRDVLPLIPMFLLGIAMGVLTSWMERTQVGAQGAEWQLSILQRILIAGRAVWFYAMKLVAPVNLSFIYTRWNVDASRAWQWIFPLAAIALVALAWALRKRCGRGPLAAILFFGGTVLPALGFVDLLPMRYSFVADHFQYLASIGLIVLICAALTTWLRDRVRPVAIVLLAILGVLTFRQAFVYENLETLWADTIAKNPAGWMPRNNLANLRIADERIDEAETLLDEALKHHPGQAELLLTKGVLVERRGDKAAAFELYRRAAAARENAAALTNMGRLMLDAGRVDDSVNLLRRAREVEPTYALAHRLLGLALVQQGDPRAAAEAFGRATELDPDSAEGWNYRGATLEKLGDLSGAIDAYERALKINPAFEQARRNLERVRGRMN
jgi:Flp pilus assembly protein TadD